MPPQLPRSIRSYPLIGRRPSLDFSMIGLVYCSMMLFMGLAAMNTQANLLFGVFGLMIGILLVSGSISRLVLRKLRVHRNLPKHAIVGEPTTIYYEFTNNKRFWPSLSVGLVELDGVEGFARQPHCYLLHAAPRMTASVPLEIIPRRRGVLELDHFQLSTSFPFGFIKRATIDRHKDTILVLPALASVDRAVIEMCRSADNMGMAVRPQSGGEDEFYGLREYRNGDSPRHIYWRRSARVGTLVSKEMTRVAPPQIILLVDTHVEGSGAAARALVERAIAMAASLAATALDDEMAVGIVGYCGGVVSIPATRGKMQREEILSLLARMPVQNAFSYEQLLREGERMMKTASTLVLATWREVDAEAISPPRGGLIVLSSAWPRSRRWFRFRDDVSFEVEDDSDLLRLGGTPWWRSPRAARRRSRALAEARAVAARANALEQRGDADGKAAAAAGASSEK